VLALRLPSFRRLSSPPRLDPYPQDPGRPPRPACDRSSCHQEAARPRRLESLHEARRYLRPRRPRPDRRQCRPAGCRRGEEREDPSGFLPERPPRHRGCHLPDRSQDVESLLFKLLQEAEGDGHRPHRRGGQAQGGQRGIGVQHAQGTVGTVPPQGGYKHAVPFDTTTSYSSATGRSWVWKRSSANGSDEAGSGFSWLKIARWLLMGYCCGRSSRKTSKRSG
jgi:hypothetical protein